MSLLWIALHHLLSGGSRGPTLQLEEPLSKQWAGTEIDLEYLHVAAGHITHHSPECKESFASVMLALIDPNCCQPTARRSPVVLDSATWPMHIG